MTNPQAFSVTCVTCGSRLKVPDRRLIGSIESCPKCGAMVQIFAPSEAPTPELAQPLSSSSLPLPAGNEPHAERLTLGDHSIVDSGAITQSSIRDVKPPAVTSANSDSAITEAGPGVDDSGRTLPPPTQAALAAQQPARGTHATEVDDYRREIDGIWQSEATQRKKQLFLIGLLSLFGLVAAGIVFSQFVRSWRKQQLANQTPDEAVANTPPLQAPPSPAPPSLKPSEQADAPEPTAMQTEQTPTSPPAEIKPPDTGISEEREPKDAPPRSPDLPQSTEPETAPNPSTVPPLETGVFVGEREPANMKPDDKGQPDPPPLNELPPGLAQFLPMANMLTADNQTAATIQPPPTIDTVRIEEAAMAAEPEAEPTTNRKPIDVEKAMAQRFAIGNQGVAFADLILVVSSLTTVPIELELLAFDAAGIPVDSPIKTPAGWMSAKQWLESTCASLGLVATTANDRIMISVDESKLDAELAKAFSLDDFGDRSREVFSFIEPLLKGTEEAARPANDAAADDAAANAGEQALVAAEMATLSEDEQTIVPGPSLRSKMQALFAIESARVIRGMPTKLDRWRTARWLGPWSDKPEEQSTIGDWPVVFGGSPIPVRDAPQPTAGLLKSIASLNGVKLLVGWYDATRFGLYPADPMMPYSRDNASGAVLEEMLGEVGLQTRACSSSLWYVCSEASYDRFEVFAWYTIPSGTGEAVRNRLANSLSVDPSTLPLVFTDTVLLVRCPRYIARQMPRIIHP